MGEEELTDSEFYTLVFLITSAIHFSQGKSDAVQLARFKRYATAATAARHGTEATKPQRIKRAKRTH